MGQEFVKESHAVPAWLSELLKEKGGDIYRSKGVLSVAGTDDK